jgi:hypothetical protein
MFCTNTLSPVDLEVCHFHVYSTCVSFHCAGTGYGQSILAESDL